mgnify:CR=1 FL=1
MAVESHDKKLDDLLKMVEEGKAKLPDFQRSWVWDDTKIIYYQSNLILTI